MSRNYFFLIVFIALLCLFLIFFSLGREISTPITKEPSTSVPTAPFKSYIFGTGVVEPSSGNIFIGSNLNRMVEKVLVKVGSKVKKSDPLLILDNRDLKSNLVVQQIAYKKAQAELQRLEAFPRSEDLSTAEAALKSSEVALELAKKQYEMVLTLPDPRLVSIEEQTRRLFNYHQAEAKFHESQAQLDKIKAGTWKPDIAIARLSVRQAEASIRTIQEDIQHTIIKSPIDGTVLQVKIHEGEYPPPDFLSAPLMVIGNMDQMNLRVSINQLDIPYFKSSAPAVAFLEGDTRVEYPLEFLHIEPYLLNKQTLTNEVTEKVDTKVMHIIYAIKKAKSQLYVGQQMDVFIETKY